MGDTPFGPVLTEFIEALVHQTLFVREVRRSACAVFQIEALRCILCTPMWVSMCAQVYDPDLFDRHRLYSIAVRKASHAGVVDYVQKLTRSLKAS